MKKISIVTPTYNEEDNIEELFTRISKAIKDVDKYEFELIFIDNCSSDKTVSNIKKIISQNSWVKLIVNARNFGHIRSPYYGILQGEGDAVIYLASDLQDPPELMLKMLENWELGFKLVMATKPASKENLFFYNIRRLYYRFLNRISDVELLNDATGFGLYDKSVIKILKDIRDPYPYLRGLICDIGYPIKTINFEQPTRARGLTKNNLYTLYDIGMLGLVSHSKLPIRIASLIGFSFGILSFIAAFVAVIYKLMYWDQISLGVAPFIIVQFFMFGLVLMFMGLIGEYISVINVRLQNRPIVVESERINF